MIWGSIKFIVFLALACVIGVFISGVQVGGKSLSARASDLWSQPTVRRAVGEVSTRLKRGVESSAATDGKESGLASPTHPATSRPAQSGVGNPARADARVMAPTAPVLAEPRPADDYKPSEREAVARLIARKSHHLAKAP